MGGSDSDGGFTKDGMGGGIYDGGAATRDFALSLSDNQAIGGSGTLGQSGRRRRRRRIDQLDDSLTLDSTVIAGNVAAGGAGGSGSSSSGQGAAPKAAASTIGGVDHDDRHVAVRQPGEGRRRRKRLRGHRSRVRGRSRRGRPLRRHGPVTLSGGLIFGNQALGGAGGSGAAGTGGPAAKAQGGGLYNLGGFSYVDNNGTYTPVVALATVSAVDANILGNQALGGAGGSGGGIGGVGAGGAAYNDAASTLSISDSLVSLNIAAGGAGGWGGGSGGAAYGGAIDNAGPDNEYSPALPGAILSLTDTIVIGNLAAGGAAASGECRRSGHRRRPLPGHRQHHHVEIDHRRGQLCVDQRRQHLWAPLPRAE